MQNIIRKEIDSYKQTLAEKIAYLQQIRTALAQTEGEINMLNGAIQACEKLLQSDDSAPRQTK